MARSFWKGKNFIKDFVDPTYEVSKFLYLKNRNLVKRSAEKHLDDIKIYRRNHAILPSQVLSINSASYFLYNGYDFISRRLPVNSLQETHFTFNIASLVYTREMQVVHKVKLSKAARKNNAKLVKKKSLVLNKTSAVKKRKAVISKKLKK